MRVAFIAAGQENVGDRLSRPQQYFVWPDHWDVEYRRLHKKAKFHEGFELYIVGGGGVLYPPLRDALRPYMLAGAGWKTAMWGIGHNCHNPKAPHTYPSELRRTSLVGLRDWDAPHMFVPCASCLHPGFDETYEIKRKIGVYAHHQPQVTKFDPKLLTTHQVMNNAVQDPSEALAFIGSSEIVVTNSYHGMYWSVLMGKPVIVQPFSTKFFKTPYPVVKRQEITEVTPWAERTARDAAKHYTGLLSLYRGINQEFFKKVIKLGAE